MFLNQCLFQIKRNTLFFIEEHYPALPLNVALTYRCDMGCFYCNTRGLDGSFKGEISEDNFSKLLAWMKKQGMRKIMFVGGEPTQHTRLESILELCRKNKIDIYMASNCAYPRDINYIIAKHVKVLFVNCSTEYASTQGLDLLNKLKFLRKYGVKLILRVNMSTANKNEIGQVRGMARELKARIRVAIINSPVLTGGLLDKEKIRKLTFFTEEFARQCLKESIYIYLARPLPRCFFDDKKWQELRRLILAKSRCFVGYRGNYACRAVVNPDLSVFGCFKNLKKADNILGFSSLYQLSEFYKANTNTGAEHCALDKHNNCRYLVDRKCSGACFDYA
jgi:organic radical activating enzyme